MASYELRVRLEQKGKPATEGIAKVLPRSAGDRAGRAAAIWFTCLAIAIPCVFIPLAHFILPPAVIITGTVLAVLRWKETESLLSLDAACPTCGVVGKMKASGPVRDGRQLHCDACGFMADLRVVSKAATGEPNTVAAPP